MLFVGSECLHIMPYFNAVPCNMPGTDIGSLTGPLGVAYFCATASRGAAGC